MAYPPLRSMNAALYKGTVEGKYKQLYPDREVAGIDGELNTTYHMRDELSLLYYGWGMKEEQDVTAGPNHQPVTGYYRNRLELEGHHGPTLGRAW